MLPKLFQEAIPAGWVYPCTLDDIAAQLALVPEDDLNGLHAVGLVPATRKDCWVDGRYLRRNPAKPIIALYSVRDDLTYRLPPNFKMADIEAYRQIELSYGMQVVREGSRITCRWETAELRRYTLEYLLMHEIGHHVHAQLRSAAGSGAAVSYRERERFADHYALRRRREAGVVAPPGVETPG